MSHYTVTHRIYRDGKEIIIEAVGCFDGGELNGFSHSPPISLTEDEEEKIEDLLIDEQMNDWDEDKWQSDRER